MTALNRALVALSITVVIAYGALFYAFGLIAPLIAREMGWSPAFVYGGASLSMLVAGLAAPWVGRAIDRRGGRAILAAGSLVAGVGTAMIGLAQGEALFLAGCLVAGIGMATGFYDATFATLAWVSGGRARRAITVLTLAGGFASTIFWPLTQYGLTLAGWRELMLAYAAIHVFVSAPLNWFGVAREPAPAPATTRTEHGHDEATRPLGGRARWIAFGLFAVTLVAHGFVSNGMALHMLPALEALGASPAAALLVGSLIGPAQVLGRLADLGFGRLVSPLTIGLAAYGALPAAFALLLIAPPGLAALVAFALLYGVGNGLTSIARGVIPLALFGREGYGGMLGLLAAPTLAAMACAPLILALVLAGAGIAAMTWVAALVSALSFAAIATLAWRYPVRPA